MELLRPGAALIVFTNSVNVNRLLRRRQVILLGNSLLAALPLCYAERLAFPMPIFLSPGCACVFSEAQPRRKIGIQTTGKP